MPKLGLALSAAGAGPVRIPAGNLIPQGNGSGGSGGSGSGSGEGIGDFLVNDSSLVMWLKETHIFPFSEPIAPGSTIKYWNNSVNFPTWGDALNEGVAPTYEPATVTVSGASSTYNWPGLGINGVYTKSGFKNSKPKYEKDGGSSNEGFTISWGGGWVIEGPNLTLLYIGNGSDDVWNTGFYPSFNGGLGTPTVTLTSPDCLRFTGSEYLSFTNPLNGSSAELFVVCNFDDLDIGEENGPLIGNIGEASEYHRYIKEIRNNEEIVNQRLSLFLPNSVDINPQYNAPFIYASDLGKWNLIGYSAGEGINYTAIKNDNIVGFFIPSIGDFLSAFSRLTYNNEGPFIGRSTQGGGAYFKGRIAEILLYNRALTPGERSVVRTYLNNKYSLWA